MKLHRLSVGTLSMLLLLAQGGCETIANSIAGYLVNRETETVTNKVTVPEPTDPGFLQCMSNPRAIGPAPTSESLVPESFYKYLSGKVDLSNYMKQRGIRAAAPVAPPTKGEIASARLAADVLDHSVFKKLSGLSDTSWAQQASRMANVSEIPSSNTGIALDEAEVQSFMAAVEKATTVDAWDNLEITTAKFVGIDPEVAELATTAEYIKQYMKSYFRSGKFAQVKIKTADFENTIKATLGISDKNAIPQIINAFFPNLTFANGEAQVFGAIGQSAFVTRGGQSFQFPPLQASVDMSSASPVNLPTLNYTNVGSDLIRVLLEAVFDAKFRVPAVGNATGVGIVGGLDKFDSNKHSITEDQFAVTEQISRSVEAGVTSALGRVLRGFSFFSLNNEPLAVTIETLVGVTLKKGTEKVCYCYFKSKGAGQAHFSEDRNRTITISISGTSPRLLRRN